MSSRENAANLFYPMLAYAKSIYDNLLILCELEKADKKQDKVYYSTLKELKMLMKRERDYYVKNSDKLFACREDLCGLVASLAKDADTLECFSKFDSSLIYERIKSKLKLYIGLRGSFNGDLLYHLKTPFARSRVISGDLLEESIISDIQNLSLFYMDNDCDYTSQKVEYKYLMALMSNLDAELLDNYFEISKKELFTGSTLIYGLNCLPKDIYLMHLTNTLNGLFKDFIEYIILNGQSFGEKYKVEIALNYLKSIVDLMPKEYVEVFLNDYKERITNDEQIPDDIKNQIVDALQSTLRGRKLIRQVGIAINNYLLD